MCAYHNPIVGFFFHEPATGTGPLVALSNQYRSIVVIFQESSVADLFEAHTKERL